MARKNSKNAKKSDSDNESDNDVKKKKAADESNSDNDQEKNGSDQEEDDEEDVAKSVPCSKVQVERLFFAPAGASEEADMDSCFPKYLYDDDGEPSQENFDEHGLPFIITSKPIHIKRGGIPNHNGSEKHIKWHGKNKNGRKRAFFYVGANEDEQSSKDLFGCLKMIDDHLISEINDKKNENSVFTILEDKADKNSIKRVKKATYTPMITTVGGAKDDDSDSDDDKKKKKKKGADEKNKKKFDNEKFDRIKIRLNTEYDAENKDGEANAIVTTRLFVGKNKKYEKVKSIADIEKHFRFRCTAQFAIALSRVWIKRDAKKECGIALKCMQIGVTKPSDFKKGVSLTKRVSTKLFDDSGSDNDSKSKSKKKVVDTKKKAKKESDDEAKDDSDKQGDDSGKDGSDNEGNAKKDASASEPEEDEKAAAKIKLKKNKKGDDSDEEEVSSKSGKGKSKGR